MTEVPRFDLTGPEVTGDPYSVFARLRDEQPVLGQPLPDGSTLWYVSRHADVLAVLHDHRHFANAYATAVPEAPPDDYSAFPALRRYDQMMLLRDAPDHTRLRALVGKAFTPRQVQALEPRVRELVVALLDELAPRGAGDLIAGFAEPLPIAVIFELLGVPLADRGYLRGLVLDMINPAAFVGADATDAERAAFRQSLEAFYDYLGELFARRRAEPRDDMVSALVAAEQDGERLSEDELHSMVQLLLVAGHETTVHLIGNAALALIQHPEQLALLRARPELIDGAVEELLRYDSPVKAAIPRYVVADVRLGGQALRRGDAIRVLVGAAGRDPAQFPAPDTLDITRDNRRSLSFGHGAHYCLGAPLARLEARVALPALFERLPGLRLAVAPSALAWRPSVLMRGLAALPAAWEPA